MSQAMTQLEESRLLFARLYFSDPFFPLDTLYAHEVVIRVLENETQEEFVDASPVQSNLVLTAISCQLSAVSRML